MYCILDVLYAGTDQTAVQSSEHSVAHHATLAIDGVFGGSGVLCSQTDVEPSPWWGVDLGRSLLVNAVALTNGQGRWHYISINIEFTSLTYPCKHAITCLNRFGSIPVIVSVPKWVSKVFEPLAIGSIFEKSP